MDKIKLDDRLMACAELIDRCDLMIDVGTDHAYIPVYLVGNQIVKKAIASDINEGPLSRAIINIREYGLSKRIETVCTDGLRGLEDKNPDSIVIAGMGGLLIRDIIKEASFTKSEKVSLILQPMKNERDLREYLLNNSYEIIDEKLAYSNKKIYQIIKARYKKDLVCDYSEIELLLGRFNIKNKQSNKELFSLLCKKYLSTYQKKITGIKDEIEKEKLTLIFNAINNEYER